MDMYKQVTFFIKGLKHEVDSKDLTPETSLNTYLRKHLHLTGTKRMCAEGGCGACIVAIRRKNPVTGKFETFAINSCLVSVFSCHGWDIYTVEGICHENKNHQVQNVLTQFNGTQCGYCSPGMVMNMYALYESKELTMNEVENSFGGNICRCTGYRPILSAFKSICKDASAELIGKYPDIEDLQLGKKCSNVCALTNSSPIHFKADKNPWIKVYTLHDLINVLNTLKQADDKSPSYMLVAGNTAKGVYRPSTLSDIYVDVLEVKELISHEMTQTKLILGANMSLTETMELFWKTGKENKKFLYLEQLGDHIDLIANVPVRNMGTLAGNLMIKHQHNDFPSDIFLILEAAGAQLEIVDINNKEYFETPKSFLKLDMKGKIIKKIILSAYDSHYKYGSFKIMPRAQNAHALVNAGFLLKLSKENIVQSARLVYGCINHSFVHADKTEKYLFGKKLFDNKTLQGAFETLFSELKPDAVLGDPAPSFRKDLAISLFYKFILSIAPESLMNKRNKSGGNKLIRPISSGVQDFETNESLYPLTKPIPKIEAEAQTTGKAEYITDMPDLPNQLFAAFVLAKAPPNSIVKNINAEKALNLKGVVAFLDKNDIPGKNTFTPNKLLLLQQEELLFCNDKVQYYFQPLGIVVANSEELAEKASNLIEVTYIRPNRPPAITISDIIRENASDKINKENPITPKSKGTNIKHKIDGEFEMSWQYHYHMETQCCNAVPKEDGLDLYPSTQWMDLTQVSASCLLNIPSNKVNVVVKRIGGAFGSKIIRNAQISCAAALAAYKLNRPVKIWLPMETNMNIIGKRCPILSNYEVAVDDKGVIQYINGKIYYDYGCGRNEGSLFLLVDSLLEYYNNDTFSFDVNTTHSDTHASSFIRAPGSVEGMSLIESIFEHIAIASGIDPIDIRLANINKEKHSKLINYIQEFREWADIDSRKEEIKRFNRANRWRKKGLSVVPMVFPFDILFSYSVFISIYHTDGTVSIAHSGVEIGQGINTKAAQVCAYKLGISMDKISVKPSNNFVTPNSFMTGASLTSEGVCYGIIKACDILLERMKPVKDKMNNPTWDELVKQSFLENVLLSATALSTPKEPELGSYGVYAVCACEIELDVLTGMYIISRVDLLEDVGNSMSPEIDIGQVEGAFVMGLGYFTSEQILYSKEGEILTNRTWNYKPPGVKDIPVDFRVKFPKNNPNKVGVLKSKATGEPPFCLAVVAPLAIRHAVASVRQEADNSQPKWYPFNGPSTVENTFTNCLLNYKQYVL